MNESSCGRPESSTVVRGGRGCTACVLPSAAALTSTRMPPCLFHRTLFCWDSIVSSQTSVVWCRVAAGEVCGWKEATEGGRRSFMACAGAPCSGDAAAQRLVISLHTIHTHWLSLVLETLQRADRQHLTSDGGELPEPCLLSFCDTTVAHSTAPPCSC